MKTLNFLIVAATLAGVSACASVPRTGPEAIASLERARAKSPDSEPVLRSLGIAYYEANRTAEARTLLDRAVEMNPKDGAAVLYLGLTAERQNDLPAARAAYSSYMNFGRTRGIRRQLSARLAALTHKELLLAARTAVAQEGQLSTTPGSPTTVAVLPMSFTGSDSSLKPLERGLADLLATDLAQSAQLTVVERARMSAILGELSLQQGGATEASTNVRAGKLLSAGRLVQGSIVQQGEQLRVDAAVVDVPTTQIAGSASDNRALEQLFTLEKNIAFDLFDQLGVVLTTAERNAVEQRPTRSLAAFLSYSRGLQAEDAGRFQDANQFYNNALQLDPGFARAQQRSAESQAAATGAQTSAATVEASIQGTAEGKVATQATQGSAAGTQGLGSTALSIAQDLNPSALAAAAAGGSVTSTTQTQKDGAAAVTGADNPANKLARIIIVIPVPRP